MLTEPHQDITSKLLLNLRLMKLESFIYPRKLEEEDIDEDLINLVIKYYSTWDNFIKTKHEF
ncbi:MAG: hypothetical protein COA79_21190 [Planctomycetota bacterium]|nr:MAG: hypothetical protein COA79_21190 [Planctomycetota bacterium]